MSNSKMKEYTIKFVDADGQIEDGSFTYPLEDSATVAILKEASKNEVIEYEEDQLRMFLRNRNGHDIGLDDDDILSEVIDDHPGQILVECASLGHFSGKIWIHKDFEEDVFLLLGSPKNFAHHNVKPFERKYEVPLGKPFELSRQKLALSLFNH